MREKDVKNNPYPKPPFGLRLTQSGNTTPYDTHYHCKVHGWVPIEECSETKLTGILCPLCLKNGKKRRVKTCSKKPKRKRPWVVAEVREVPLTDAEVMELLAQ